MDEKRRLIDTSAIDEIVGYRLRRAQMAVFGSFLKSFAEADIKPADYSALVLIADNPGLRPSQIAAALGIQRANFVALANGLEERGLVERRPHAGDRRALTLELTPPGRDFVARLRAVQEQFEAEIIRQLGGTNERDRLIELLARLG